MQRNATVVTVIVMVAAALSAVQPGCARRPGSGPELEAVSDQLPSWNDGAAKQAIVGFVDRVTDPASPDFVSEPERIAVFDNSDGDFQMLEWTTAGPGARLGVLIHHTDAEREWAYDRDSHIGRLDAALDEAAARGWTVVSMKDDWNAIHPPGE